MQTGINFEPVTTGDSNNDLSINLGKVAAAHFVGSPVMIHHPGVPLRSTPGFMLSPAPQAKTTGAG